MLKEFVAYTNQKLKTIPLWPGSKTPISKGWQQKWNFHKNYRIFERFPDANIGLLLGKVIDVESDNESGNELLENLTKNSEPHPIFSSSKSIHHLFLNNFDKSLTVLKTNNIEFRGFRHHSVLPPSKHQDGNVYNWIYETDKIPVLPKKLLSFYLRSKNQVLKPGFIQPWCSKCKIRRFIHEKRFNLELLIFKNFGLGWTCNKCRDVDLREFCRIL